MVMTFFGAAAAARAVATVKPSTTLSGTSILDLVQFLKKYSTKDA